MYKALASLLGQVYNVNNNWSEMTISHQRLKSTRSCSDCWGYLWRRQAPSFLYRADIRKNSPNNRHAIG